MTYGPIEFTLTFCVECIICKMSSTPLSNAHAARPRHQAFAQARAAGARLDDACVDDACVEAGVAVSASSPPASRPGPAPRRQSAVRKHVEKVRKDAGNRAFFGRFPAENCRKLSKDVKNSCRRAAPE